MVRSKRGEWRQGRRGVVIPRQQALSGREGGEEGFHDLCVL